MALYAILILAIAQVAEASDICCVPTRIPGRKPVIELPGLRPISPVTVLAPIFVIVVLAKIAKSLAVPRFIGAGLRA